MRTPKLHYVSARGERMPLDGPTAFTNAALELRGRSWSYDLGYRAIGSVARAAREASLDIAFSSPSAAAEFRRIADGDVRDMTPGSFEAPGGWSQRAYIVSSETEAVYRNHVKVRVGVVLLDGVWRKPETIELVPGGALSDGKGFPHGFPYSYGTADGFSRIESLGSLPGPVSIVFYGPATNPSITIGGNRFAVECSVPSGGHLDVDGVNLSVTLVNEYGERSNEIASAVRGAGKGSGEYIFEEVGGSGEVLVSWPGTFGATVTYWNQEMEPPFSGGEG